MTRDVIYARVSTSRRAERDLSMPDQIAQCRASASPKRTHAPFTVVGAAPWVMSSAA